MASDANTAGLNFDSASLDNATTGTTHTFHLVNDGILPWASVLALIIVVAASCFWVKRMYRGYHATLPLISKWPPGLRVALIPLLSAYALTHALSAVSVFYNTQIVNASTEVYFENMGIGRLASLSHAHFFAHATMYFLLATLVQFSGRGFIFVVIAPLLALWAGIFDVISWWGLKVVSPQFETLSALSGAAFSLSFLVMSYAILASAFGRPKSMPS